MSHRADCIRTKELEEKSRVVIREQIELGKILSAEKLKKDVEKNVNESDWDSVARDTLVTLNHRKAEAEVSFH